METTRKHLSGRRSGHGSLIRKVQQDQRNLLGLQRHLRSYACEPRTPVMFERRETLSHALDGIKSKNQLLLKDLSGPLKSGLGPDEQFRIQHRMCQDLENKIIAYLGDARQSS
jgi:hypothetical protein